MDTKRLVRALDSAGEPELAKLCFDDTAAMDVVLTLVLKLQRQRAQLERQRIALVGSEARERGAKEVGAYMLAQHAGEEMLSHWEDPEEGYMAKQLIWELFWRGTTPVTFEEAREVGTELRGRLEDLGRLARNLRRKQIIDEGLMQNMGVRGEAS